MRTRAQIRRLRLYTLAAAAFHVAIMALIALALGHATLESMARPLLP